jgi:PAS domain S-box-containing protein
MLNEEFKVLSLDYDIFFKAIFEKAPILIFVIQKKGRFSLWNRECERTLGWSWEEVRKMKDPLLVLFPESSYLRSLLSALSQSDGRFNKYQVRAKDRSFRHQMWSITRLSDDQIMVIGSDITEQRKAELAYDDSQNQLRNFSAHLEFFREDERTRIARDIHDVLGQMLSLLQIDLKWLEHRISSDQKSLIVKIHSMYSIIDSVIEWVRKFSQELRPNVLDNVGIGAAVEWLADEFKKQSEISCQVNVFPPKLVMENKISTAVFRIIQEALTNVRRHSGATKVELFMEKKEEFLNIRVKDNGVGILEDQIHNSKSLGLMGIKERVRLLKGQFNVQGIPGAGTTVFIRIPLKN